jgi:DNA invertase Pin-like site-specific DNA recombinase
MLIGQPGTTERAKAGRPSWWLIGVRPTDPVGRPLFNALAMVAESDLIRLRTKEGMKVAKAKGRLRGQQPKLNRRQEVHLVALLKGGEYSTAELADLFGVTRSTVYRAVERERVRAIEGVGSTVD